jgi:hypothetical protein
MANQLNTPIVNWSPAFDPAFSHTFTFSYTGNQAVKNRAVIYDNDTYENVYDRIQEGLKLDHVLPSNTLAAGRTYVIQIQVFDAAGASSALSAPVVFQCFTSPEFYFSNAEDKMVLSSANLTVLLSYSQTESEPLQQFQYYLYGQDRTMLYSSDVFYDGANLTHTIYGFHNDNIYYLRAVGRTVHGMELDTGYLQIIVQYQIKPANILFSAQNHREGGYLSYYTGIKSIGYETQNDHYSFAGGEVTLWDNMLTYNDQFCITGDFTVVLKARKLPLETFFRMKADDCPYEISMRMLEIDGLYYCRLTVPYGLGNYVFYRELPKAELADAGGLRLTTASGIPISIVNLTYNAQDLVTFTLRRKGGLYSLTLSFEEEEA